MPSHFVYILQSANGKFYIGYTTDLERRMKQHQSGKGSKFVRGFGFEKLLYHETYRTKSKALKREAELKGWPRSKKEKLISAVPLLCKEGPGEVDIQETTPPNLPLQRGGMSNRALCKSR